MNRYVVVALIVLCHSLVVAGCLAGWLYTPGFLVSYAAVDMIGMAHNAWGRR
jgi:hypothetical protein